MKISHILLPAFVAMICVTGCHREDVKLAPVTGEVLLDGKPVQGVFIIFQPTGGKPAYAMIDARGQFKLQYNVKSVGALVGLQEVFLRPPGADESGELPEGITTPTPIPDRFRRPFQTVEVTTSKNEFRFDLTTTEQERKKLENSSKSKAGKE